MMVAGLAVLGVVAIVAVFQLLSFRGTGEDNTAIGTGEASFDQILNNSEAEELVPFFEAQTFDPDSEIAVRRDVIRKQVAIANRILELAPDRELEDKASLWKLKALTQREVMGQENRMISPLESTELAEFASELVDSDEGTIARNAAYAVAVAAVSKLLEFPADEQYLQVAIRRIREAAEANPDHATILQKLYRTLQTVRERSGPTLFQQLATPMLDAIDSSRKPEIAALAERLRSQQFQQQFEFADFVSSAQAERADKINKFVQQTREGLADSRMTEDEMLRTIDRVTNLLIFRETDEAKSLLTELQTAFGAANSPRVVKSLGLLGDRIGLFAEGIDFSVFEDIDGKPIADAPERKTGTILFFVSALRYRDSIESFSSLVRSIDSSLDDRLVELYVICIGNRKDEFILENIREFSQASERWQAWLLNEDKPASQQLMKRLGTEQLPLIVLLDGKRKIVSIDTPVEVVREIIFNRNR